MISPQISFRSLLVIAVVVGALALSVSGEIYDKNGIPHVKLSNGAELFGKVEHSRSGQPFHSFQGVPFAKVKERFTEAELIQEKPAWQGVFDATKPGPVCLQPLLAQSEIQTIGEEDCLNLYIYVPANKPENGTGSGFPVMVFLHGGGYAVGGGNLYGPKFLLDENVILITLNYRLGILGFLSTGDEVNPGNWGLKDQILGLRWIQENIKNFNGDSSRVTVFGESAGGGSVHALMISPATKGLFHRAISQSGSLISPWSYTPNPKATAVKLANHLRCPTSAQQPSKISSEEILTCLKKQPTGIINAAQFTFAPRWPAMSLPLKFGPAREPSFLPDIWGAPSKDNKDIPWMIGSTEDEGATLYTGFILQNGKLLKDLDSDFTRIAPLAYEIERLMPDDQTEINVVAEKIREFYFPSSKPISEETRGSLMDLYSDSYFNHGIRKMIIAASQQQPVYAYTYAYKGPASAMKTLGFPQAEEESKKVAHGDDLLMLFNLDNVIPTAANIVEPGSTHEDFSKKMVKLWTSFAKDGKPELSWTDSGDEWEPISKAVEEDSPLKLYRIDSSPAYVTENDGFLKRNTFWETLYKTHFENAFSSQNEQKIEL